MKPPDLVVYLRCSIRLVNQNQRIFCNAFYWFIKQDPRKSHLLHQIKSIIVYPNLPPSIVIDVDHDLPQGYAKDPPQIVPFPAQARTGYIAILFLCIHLS